MKKIAYLFAIIFFVSAVFTAPAKAEDYFWSGEHNIGTPAPNNSTPASNNNNSNNNGGDHKKGDGGNGGGGTALPINSGVVLLMIAGLAIGITSLNKIKNLQLVSVSA